MIFIFIIAGIFFLLSIPLLMGKGSWLIAGYSGVSPKEKQKYNEKKLCRTTGIFTAYCAVLTVILAIVDTEAFAVAYGILLWAGAAAFFICANVCCRKK